MIYDPMSGALYGADGSFIKSVHCPMSLRIGQLSKLSRDSPDRHCNSCSKTIFDADQLTESDLKSMVLRDPGLCVFATGAAKNIIFLKPIGVMERNTDDLPVIQTARNLESMVDAQVRGFRVLIKDCGVKNEFGDSKYLVYQNARTGEIWSSGDYRSPEPEMGSNDDWKLVSDFVNVRPDRPFPLAAYLVPKDLQPGSRVFIEDVIGDIEVVFWNQGNASRIVSSAGVWDGTDITLRDRYDDVGPAAVG